MNRVELKKKLRDTFEDVLYSNDYDKWNEFINLAYELRDSLEAKKTITPEETPQVAPTPATPKETIRKDTKENGRKGKSK